MSIIKPQFTGLTNSVGVTATNTIYGRTPSDSNYVAVNHRTYLYTYMQGDYTFNVPDCDDITIVWIGSKAYSGYSRQNAQLVQNYVPSGGNSITSTIPLAQGLYVPVRVLFGNGGGPGRFGFTITGPDGKVIVSRDSTTPSPYLIQYSCDLGIKAPKFPDWGMET